MIFFSIPIINHLFESAQSSIILNSLQSIVNKERIKFIDIQHRRATKMYSKIIFGDAIHNLYTIYG
jgi:hypothetical protein